LPRVARKLSNSGMYHVMVRGINRQDVFLDTEDVVRYLQTLQELKKDSSFSLYAYCFMSNHVHLLIKEGSIPLGLLMRRLGSSYVFWYNRKYDRIGYLFQDRYKSEAVEDESYFLTVLRYIHQNPIKAGIIKTISSYPWSSYPEYLSGEGFADIEVPLTMLHTDPKKAIKAFIDFHKLINDDKCIEIDTKHLLSDQEAENIIIKLCCLKKASDLKHMEKLARDVFVKQLKGRHDLSTRQLERLTGIGRNAINRAL
jgi:putative transposase